MDSVCEDEGRQTLQEVKDQSARQGQNTPHSPLSHSHPQAQTSPSTEGATTPLPLNARVYRKTSNPTLSGFSVSQPKAKKGRRNISLSENVSASVDASRTVDLFQPRKSASASFKQPPGVIIPLAPQAASLEDLETAKSRRRRGRDLLSASLERHCRQASLLSHVSKQAGGGIEIVVPESPDSTSHADQSSCRGDLHFAAQQRPETPHHGVALEANFSSPIPALQYSCQQTPLEQTPDPPTPASDRVHQRSSGCADESPQKSAMDGLSDALTRGNFIPSESTMPIPSLEKQVTGANTLDSTAGENIIDPAAVESSPAKTAPDKSPLDGSTASSDPYEESAAPNIAQNSGLTTETALEPSLPSVVADITMPTMSQPYHVIEPPDDESEQILFVPRRQRRSDPVSRTMQIPGSPHIDMGQVEPQPASHILYRISVLSSEEYNPAADLLVNTLERIKDEKPVTFLKLAPLAPGGSERTVLLLEEEILGVALAPEISDIPTRSEDYNVTSSAPSASEYDIHHPKQPEGWPNSDRPANTDPLNGVKPAMIAHNGQIADHVHEADLDLIPGPAGRPLQNISNFPGQQNNQPRTLNTNGRLPANKPAAGPTWASAGTLSMQSQAREAAASSAMESYARATDGQQSSTRPFIDADFPTLANPSNQPQSSQFAAGAWNKPMPSEQSQRQQRQSRTSAEPTSARTQRSADGEDFFASNPTSNRQSQTMNPTGGNELPRRSSIFQNDGYQSSGFGNRMIPPGIESQIDPDARDPSRLTSPTGLSQGLSSSRSPNPQALNGTIGQDRLNGGAPGLSSMPQRTVRQSDYTRPSPQMSQGLTGLSPQDAFSGVADTVSPSGGEQQEQTLQQILDGMSPQDRWGLAGLNAAFQGPDDFRRSLAVGQDLTDLGLRMDDPEPFLKTWTGPFSSPDAAPPRPLNDDFSIPSCYSVQNVVPLRGRITCFSDETLFYIFYTQVKDIMQELVAEELMGRKWRFHIPMGMWMTRDENAQPPVEVEQGISESGTYWWWDFKTWQKVRKPFILKYTDLDDHLQRGAGIGSGAGGGALTGRNGFNAVPDLERMAAGMGRGF